MPALIPAATRIHAEGDPPKTIEEYVGRVNSAERRLSIAHMQSPAGWAEPGQTPEFDEYTVVLRGALLVEHEGGALRVEAGQAIHCAPGEWVRYSTPEPGGADYVSICLPAFSPDTAHRDG
ncbi:MAG TPA: cupin [Actinomycetota bacterium]|nr:cupin [Actinomycetota bacterium]